MKLKQKGIITFGFTLIELLVVIAIIALLASIILIALASARQKSRVATRIADLREIANALELYSSDNGGSYPNSGGTDNWRSACTAFGGYPSSQVVWDTTLNQGLVPTYIGTFPTDPSMIQTSQNCFLYTSNGTDYKVIDYNLTDMTAAQIAQYPGFEDPKRNGLGATDGCGGTYTTQSLGIWTPGANCW